MRFVSTLQFHRSFVARLAAGSILAAAWLGGCKGGDPPAAPTSPASATSPATTAANSPDENKPEPKPISYLDVVRSAYPDVSATQPLAAAVSLKEASRFVLVDPVLLDEQGHLWITKTGAPKTESALRAAPDAVGNEHVVPEKINYAWWVPDKGGDWTPMAIVPAGRSYELVTPTRRQPMGSRSDYAWGRARSWADGDAQRLVVPTSRGISIFTYHGHRQPPSELYQALGEPAGEPTSTLPPATSPAGDDRTRQVCFAFDPLGVIAWLPAATPNPKPQDPARPEVPAQPETPANLADSKIDAPKSARSAFSIAARFTAGAWQALPLTDWPAELLHVIPLRDGSVTQLIADGQGMRLGFTAISSAAISRKAVDDLLERLGDGDSTVRSEAFTQLANFGPGLLPVLKSIPEEDISPAARSAVRSLLKRQTAPMLGGLATNAEHLRLVRRLRDGGILLYTEDGVTFPDPQGEEPIRQAPAWIAARPGRPVELLPSAMMADVKPENPQVDVASGKWVVMTDGHGPKLYAASLFKNLLRKADADYTEVVGTDRVGRWLLRKPGASTGPTLVIDPTVADVSRLPVWVFENLGPDGQAVDGLVGWDKLGWPAVRQGTLERRLTESDWAPLGENNPILVELPAEKDEATPSPATRPAATRSASTQPSATAPATRPIPSGPRLLTDTGGNQYYDGAEQLTVVRSDGVRVDWALSGTSAGQAPVTLILASDRLYLFNAPGRVLRIKATPDGPQPFVLEKSFARDIPNGEAPRRIWKDPANRIVLAMEQKLIILFPSGYISPAIREKMRDEDDEND